MDMEIKICGMKSLEAAKAAEEAGAGFLGFVFHAPSHRNVPPALAASICREVKACKTVGVFVDEALDRVNEIARWCNFDYVQLHGHEDAAYARRVERPVIKAFRWGDDFQAEAANKYPAEIILLDSYSKHMAGGTGRSFAWQEAARAVKELEKPLFIAGGITAENAREAADIFHPYGLDVSGSLEENGEKSPKKIRQFMEAAVRCQSSEGLS